MNDDRSLVEAVLAHAPGAFERLVRTHQKLVWHVVERMLRAVREAAADERIERWMIRVAGLIGVVALIVFAAPTLLESLGPGAARTMPAAVMLASPLLWAAVAGVVTAGLMDSWLKPRPIGLDVRQVL